MCIVVKEKVYEQLRSKVSGKAYELDLEIFNNFIKKLDERGLKLDCYATARYSGLYLKNTNRIIAYIDFQRRGIKIYIYEEYFNRFHNKDFIFEEAPEWNHQRNMIKFDIRMNDDREFIELIEHCYKCKCEEIYYYPR